MVETQQMTFTNRAFVKVQLHAAKYPHCAVSGLLLADKEAYDSKENNKPLVICDAIPLFHQCVQLTPMLEVALTNVDAYCSSYQYYIAGYYEAPEHLKASVEPSMFAQKVALKMKAKFDAVKLVVLDNKQVPATDSLWLFDSTTGGKWKESAYEMVYEDNAAEVVEHMIERKVERDLCDFDNHLDDITQDWLNTNINQLVVMN